MRIAHLSDTHLGFKSYSKLTPQGVNQREVDVMSSFQSALAQILQADPDLVIHAGDFFHVVRPSNHSITAALAAVTKFQAARKNRPFVLVGGNHDTPKTSDIGNIQGAIAQISGVRFASQMSQRIDIPELDCEVLCVPSNSLVAREEVIYRPTLGRAYSVLSVHGMAAQALPSAVDISHADFDVHDLHADRFDYVALGDYHNFTRYAENCCFSGSTDFTTTNIWDEVTQPKGWVLYDTDRCELTHHPVPTRRVIDLPIIDADGKSVFELQDLLGQTFEGQPIVRQKIVNLHPSDRATIVRSSLVREMQSQCLNYQIVTTPPLRDKGDGTVKEGVTGQTVESLWSSHALGVNLPAGWSTEGFALAGLDLLKEVAQCA